MRLHWRHVQGGAERIQEQIQQVRGSCKKRGERFHYRSRPRCGGVESRKTILDCWPTGYHARRPPAQRCPLWRRKECRQTVSIHAPRVEAIRSEVVG